MKNKFLKTFAFFILAAILTTSISGCKKDRVKDTGISATQVSRGVLLKKLTDEQKDFLTNKKIAVVFGYNHNDFEFIEKTKLTLDALYGSNDENGNPTNFIFTITYPDDFSYSGRIRNSRLLDLVEENLSEEETLAGLLILGSPEGLHSAIAKLQDEFEKKEIKFPVFSFFSQDDVLGTEATSDIVLEFEQKSALVPIEGENDGMTESEAPKEDIEYLVTGAIKKIIELKGSCPKEDGTNLEKLVEEIEKNKHKVKNYSDSETGLLSKNHFVLGSD